MPPSLPCRDADERELGRSRITRLSFAAPKNHKAGLVGPAFACGTGSVNLVWFNLFCSTQFRRPDQNVKIRKLSPLVPRGHRPAPRDISYITNARFSSSYCSTGRAHPAISTRPAASRAALGDTP